MSYLYKSPRGGYEVRSHSYSAGSDFRKCAKFYYYRKIAGWAEKEQRASAEFGKALELALQYYHTHGCRPGMAGDEWRRLWLSLKDRSDFTYKDKEGDWTDLYKAGIDLMSVYELKWGSFGYAAPKFQAKYEKELWPGDPALGGLKFVGYVDMLATWEEPLAKAQDLSGRPLTLACTRKPIIIDIKTSGSELSETPEMLQLDPQLRAYAWVSGIPDVAFLWFQRSKPGAFKKGDDVTFLDGQTAKVFKQEEGRLLYVPDGQALGQVADQFDRISGKGTKERTASLLTDLLNSGQVSVQNLDNCTKQSITFVRTRISEEEQREAGESIGKEIREIVQANETGEWLKRPGVRWPEDKCKYCACLGLCLGNQKMVEEKLFRIGDSLPTSVSNTVQESEANWLDEI